MKVGNWGSLVAAVATLATLGTGAAWGQYPPIDPSQIVVIREKGRPERRCLIEQAYPQPDGKALYLVRDLATGERMRVLDARTKKSNELPIVGQVVYRSNAGDAEMAEALADSPVNDTSAHVPTTAELAGKAKAGSTDRKRAKK